MKKFFKIGEISKLYGIGVDSIRYYEEIGIIKPERSESGYRHYSIHDIWRLNVIRDLRSIGFTMEQIREYLEHHTVSSSLSMLEDEKEAISKHWRKTTFGSSCGSAVCRDQCRFVCSSRWSADRR